MGKIWVSPDTGDVYEIHGGHDFEPIGHESDGVHGTFAAPGAGSFGGGFLNALFLQTAFMASAGLVMVLNAILWSLIYGLVLLPMLVVVVMASPPVVGLIFGALSVLLFIRAFGAHRGWWTAIVLFISAPVLYVGGVVSMSAMSGRITLGNGPATSTVAYQQAAEQPWAAIPLALTCLLFAFRRRWVAAIVSLLMTIQMVVLTTVLGGAGGVHMDGFVTSLIVVLLWVALWGLHITREPKTSASTVAIPGAPSGPPGFHR